WRGSDGRGRAAGGVLNKGPRAKTPPGRRKFLGGSEFLPPPGREKKKGPGAPWFGGGGRPGSPNLRGRPGRNAALLLTVCQKFLGFRARLGLLVGVHDLFQPALCNILLAAVNEGLRQLQLAGGVLFVLRRCLHLGGLCIAYCFRLGFLSIAGSLGRRRLSG